jgi:(p)ppGpp synthase/HD superfamily hydrolase
MLENNYSELRSKGVALVKNRITGTRKGLDNRPNYYHSMRVCEKLEYQEAEKDVCLAGLLHDVIEDGGVSFDELYNLGFSERTIDLINLCSHNIHIQDSTERWIFMIANLINAKDEDAWRIKLVDITDNLTESAGLIPENQKFMIETKAPIFLRLTAQFPSLQDYRNELQAEINLRQARVISDADKTKSKLDKMSEAFLDGLNSVPREEQY